jgi:hypothetical protein
MPRDLFTAATRRCGAMCREVQLLIGPVSQPLPQTDFGIPATQRGFHSWTIVGFFETLCAQQTNPLARLACAYLGAELPFDVP